MSSINSMNAINKDADWFTPMHLWVSIGCVAFLILGPLAAALEMSMVTHVLGLYPLLIAIGFGIGFRYFKPLASCTSAINRGGIAGLLLITFTAFFWMIPRWMDASLLDWRIALAKYVSLIFLIGLPLVVSWHRMHPVTRGMFKIEFLSMLLRLGWLFLISPDRLCNNYLLNDQANLGWGLLIVGFSLAVTWAIPVFFGPWETLRWPSRRRRAS